MRHRLPNVDKHGFSRRAKIWVRRVLERKQKGPGGWWVQHLTHFSLSRHKCHSFLPRGLVAPGRGHGPHNFESSGFSGVTLCGSPAKSGTGEGVQAHIGSHHSLGGTDFWNRWATIGPRRKHVAWDEQMCGLVSGHLGCWQSKGSTTVVGDTMRAAAGSFSQPLFLSWNGTEGHVPDLATLFGGTWLRSLDLVVLRFFS